MREQIGAAADEERAASTFAGQLRRFRQQAGMTLEGLAGASGVSVRTIGGLERGHILGPQRRTVTALADGLGLDEPHREALERLAEVGRPRPVTAPAGWCVPPRPVSEFTGRRTHLARLAALAGAGPTASVVVLSGPGGIGKTTLAVEAARLLADERGLGLLHVDLRGMDAEPLDPGVALFRLLKALGVGNRDIPDEVEGRSGQLRTLLRERPAIIVLDNARDEQQVRPLLPGLGSSFVLVTSRRLLTGLQGVERMAVPVLEAQEAFELLRSISGDVDGPRGEGLADLAALCGGLPLALRIIGNRLATRPGWSVRELQSRLADSERRLERIAAGDLKITAAFGMSYDQLSAAARRLCRRLALVPGPDFAAPLASVLIGSSVYDAEDLLDELHELGLLSQRGEGRYGFHDLIRLFAGDRLAAEEEPPALEETTRAMTDWLLRVTVAAGRWFEPDYGAAPTDWGLPVDLPTRDAAGAWLHTEADNWFGALHLAAAHGWDREIVETAEALHYFSDHWLHWAHWYELFSLGAAAAERLDDAVAHATQLNYVSWAEARRREYPQATRTALRAARIARQAGDIPQQAWGHLYAGNALVHQDPAAALPHARAAEGLFVQVGDPVGRLYALHSVAMLQIRLGRTGEGIEGLRKAMELARVPQDGAARQLAMDAGLLLGGWYLARAYEQDGEDKQAEEAYRETLADAERAGMPHQHAEAERGFARLLERSGRLDEAAAVLGTARSRFLALDAREQVAEADRLLAEWRDRQ